MYSRIVALESEANAFPHNVSKQVTLWRAILDMDTPTGHQRIINRWERLLEFVRDASFLYGRQAYDFKGTKQPDTQVGCGISIIFDRTCQSWQV